jgi:ferrous iron transport protein B
VLRGKAKAIEINREEIEGVIALVGATNVGKSTLFNVLTRQNVKVSNWPGTTVSKHEGLLEIDGEKYLFIDLPGIHGYYSLTLDESISKNYLLEGSYDLVIVIGDYSDLVRSLYTVILVSETFLKNLIVINKSDLIDQKSSQEFDELISKRLGVESISISAIKENNIDHLIKRIKTLIKNKYSAHEIYVNYGDLEKYIQNIIEVLSKYSFDRSKISLRGLAVNFLAEDPDIESFIAKTVSKEDHRKLLEIRLTAKKELNRDLTEIIISSRYAFIEDLIKRSSVAKYVYKETYEKTWIDKIMEKPMGSAILLLGILFSLFLLIFIINTGFPLNIIFSLIGLEDIAVVIEENSLSGLLSKAFEYLSDYIRSLMSSYPEPLVGLLTDGIIAGVGAVIAFMPLIYLVSLGFAILEDSGVATRLAVGLHKTFSRFGFSGRYAYPMFVSLGCNVPGVMLSRGAFDSRERLAQILSIPFIPCQARLIVALAVAQALFSGEPLYQALLILWIYILGIMISLISGFIIRRLVLKERYSPELIIDLPRIHRPYAKVVGWISWSYTKEFLIRAGVVIFILSIFIWFITNFGPEGYTTEFSQSYGYIIGSYVTPFLKPFNINNSIGPIIGLAFLQGFVAKEGLLSTLTIITGSEDPVSAINSLQLTASQMISILTFGMLYVPCLATLSVIYQETRSWRWTLFSIIYMLSIAYIVTLVTYHTLIIFMR